MFSLQLISRKTLSKKIGTSTVGSISKQSIVRTNIGKGATLKNFLGGLEITGAIQKLKRVILTTGAKQYGGHLGPPKQPMEESDPWIEGSTTTSKGFLPTKQSMLDGTG